MVQEEAEKVKPVKFFFWELGKDLFGKYSLDPKILAGKSIIKDYPAFTPES